MQYWNCNDNIETNFVLYIFENGGTYISGYK